MRASSLPDFAISARDLTKIYPRPEGGETHKALDKLTLDVPKGSVFGLLGPNGAGKSTFINILGGLVKKTDGRVSIWGRDIDKEARNSRAAVGIVPQELNMDPFFRPLQLLDIMAGLYGIPKSERKSREIIEMVGLADQAHVPMRSLSGGMLRRLLIAKAFVHSPPVVILDEPTAGVDVKLRRQIWKNIRLLNQQGMTILLTTHYLEEAEQLCDQIAIINHGKLVVNEKTSSLLRRIDAKKMVITLKNDLAAIPDSLKNYHVHLTKNRLVLTYQRSNIPAGEILKEIVGTGLEIDDISTEDTDLETVFLQLTETKTTEGN